MESKRASSKLSFSIKPINIEKVEQTYSLSIQSNISKPGDSRNATKISELQVSIEPDIISYLDESKKPRKCIPTMLCHFRNQIIPEKTDIHCFWCRHSFPNIPISCPIRYVSSQVEKRYTSEITRDTYQIKENVDLETVEEEQLASEQDKIRVLVHDKDYYESDGIFCSFNCCLSYIEENRRNSLYKNSRTLLFKIYSDIFEMSPKNLIPAGSWRLLTAFGGHLSITQFRKNLNKIQYNEQNRIVYHPKFVPMGVLYEEKSKF